MLATMLFQSTRPVRGATAKLDLDSARKVFQSTRPVRGATSTARRFSDSSFGFNPRAPCGARRLETGDAPV